MVVTRTRASGSRTFMRQPAERPPEVADRLCKRFEDWCHERGIRVTAQRLAVYRSLVADTSHPTADTVHDRLRRGMSSLSQATVYRILKFLENEGLVQRVGTTDGVGRFDANISRHQHLVCRVCGSIRDCEEMNLSSLSLPRRPTAGFVAEAWDIRIVGTCEKCLGRSETKRFRKGKP